MIVALILLAQMETLHLQGWSVKICRPDNSEPCRYSPAPFPSKEDCLQVAPHVPNLPNFRGWTAECVYVNGPYELRKQQ